MRRIKLLIASGLSIIIIGIVLFQIDWYQTWTSFKSINLFWFVVAFIFHLGTYILRTQRFRVLLGLKDRQIQLSGVTNLSGMYMYLLPFRTGELSFPLLLKEQMNLPLVQGTAALFLARILDLIIMALLLPILMVVHWADFPLEIRISTITICLIVIFSWLVFLYFVREPEKLDVLYTTMTRTDSILLNKIGDIAARVFREMRKIFLERKFWPAMIFSVGIWILVQFTLYCIISSFGFSISIYQVYVITLILIPVTLIPIQGFANLGSHELSFVLAFSLFGFTYVDALNISVGSHIVFLIFSLILGLIGFLLLKIRIKN